MLDHVKSMLSASAIICLIMALIMFLVWWDDPALHVMIYVMSGLTVIIVGLRILLIFNDEDRL